MHFARLRGVTPNNLERPSPKYRLKMRLCRSTWPPPNKWLASRPRVSEAPTVMNQPREVQARWCQSTSQHFSNRNMKAKAMGEASQQPDSQGRREVGVDWSKYNATGYRIEEF